MKILVTGATGFLGSRVIEQFAEYDEVTAIVAAGRTLKPSHTVHHDKIVYQLGDLLDSDYVKSLCQQVDYIVNCASLSSPFGDYPTFHKQNVETQKLLIEVAEQNAIQRFVYISTPSIYNDYRSRYNIKENEPLPSKMVNHYAATKLIAEQLLGSSKLEFVILRPRALVGRGDTVIMPRLINAVEKKRLRIIGDGENLADLTAVSNVADAIWLGLNAPESSCREVYNITNGAPVNLWEHIKYCLGGLGMTISDRKLSYQKAMVIASILEFIAKFTKKEPTLQRYSVSTLAMPMTLDISKAKRLLGYQPKVNTKEAIDEFVEWYKKENSK